jgi:hypothetical protein
MDGAFGKQGFMEKDKSKSGTRNYSWMLACSAHAGSGTVSSLRIQKRHQVY